MYVVDGLAELDSRPAARGQGVDAAAGGRDAGVRRPRRAAPERPGAQPRRARALLGLLVATSVTVMTLDYRGGDDSPVEPARRVVAEVLGPVQSVAATALRPVLAVPRWFRTQGALRGDLAELQAENSRLRSELATSGLDRVRLQEYDALAGTAGDLGHDLVPAHVIAHGAAQTFSRTVTIDAGTDAGVTADLTVVTADGLVGRVVRAGRTTATVLLVVDAGSVVGGRLGRDLEVGFLRGTGELGEAATLRLDLIDDQVVPAQGDVVVTWGSEGGAPYVPGVPIGRVASVLTSPRQQSASAVVEPSVDFSALDLVGVVVPSEAPRERSVLARSRAGGEPDGQPDGQRDGQPDGEAR